MFLHMQRFVELSHQGPHVSQPLQLLLREGRTLAQVGGGEGAASGREDLVWTLIDDQSEAAGTAKQGL